MNTLNIVQSKKHWLFAYTTDNYELDGTCIITEDNTIERVDTTIYTISDNINIGNCNYSINNISINIYNTYYDDKLSEISTIFGSLIADINDKLTAEA